jgi:hypothetical protein
MPELTKLNIRAPKTTHSIEIDVEDNDGIARLAKCELRGFSDDVVTAILNDLFLSIAKHADLAHDRLNGNIYKTEWINGI